MGVRRGWNKIRRFPLEIGIKNQKFLVNLMPETKFRLIDLILAMTVFLPV